MTRCKKALSLILVLAILTGLMVVPSFASGTPSPTDKSSTAVVTAVGLGTVTGTKLVVNYLLGSDPSGRTNGTWMLSEKNADTVAEIFKLQAVVPKGKKFDAKEDKWGTFTANGVPVQDMENGKAVKTTYFYRVAPDMTTLTAASKTMKVTATSVSKARVSSPTTKRKS